MSAETTLAIPSTKEINSILNIKSSPDLDWYFPNADPGNLPLGARVIVQLRRTKKTSSGGIILHSDTKDTEKWNNQVAKVIAIGPLAYRNRSTQEAWPEGIWVSIGDFVRVPRWGGDRWDVEVENEEEKVTFAIFNDSDVITKITADPLKVISFIL